MPKALDSIGLRSIKDRSAKNKLQERESLSLLQNGNLALAAEFSLYIMVAGDFCNLYHHHTNHRLLEKLQYTPEEFECMGQNYCANLFYKEGRLIIQKMINYLSQHPRQTVYDGAFKMRPKKDAPFWLYWNCAVTEWYGLKSPKIFFFSGAIMDSKSNLFDAVRQYQIEKTRQLNKHKNNLLTLCEIEIMPFIYLGLTASQIADRMFVSPKAIEKRIQSMCQKLEVTGHVALALYIYQNGFE
jgi:DNA-binding CsgD family transcriptional regulator